MIAMHVAHQVKHGINKKNTDALVRLTGGTQPVRLAIGAALTEAKAVSSESKNRLHLQHLCPVCDEELGDDVEKAVTGCRECGRALCVPCAHRWRSSCHAMRRRYSCPLCNTE